MITADKLKLFEKYSGDIDAWARIGSKKEQLIIMDNDWYIIDDLIQDLNLIRKGITSEDFQDKFKLKLKTNCDSEEAIKKLESIANKINQNLKHDG
ncbi:MAG: hypothetical protein K0R65_854 [Crocinitomicaceae bacterium]|jgi:hypothetical protein|nr:hypothetical protein [Crocinitomicaceae bacterium]